MEFNFDVRRLILLGVLLGGFAMFDGFNAPKVSVDGPHSQARVQKAWSYCVLLFVIGAVSTSLVEHTVGYMDPTNLRPAYVVLGVVLMIASIIWLRSLRQSITDPPKATALRHAAQGWAHHYLGTAIGDLTSPPFIAARRQKDRCDTHAAEQEADARNEQA